MSKAGKSRKRKLSGSADEVERMRVVMKVMADKLKAADDKIKASGDELETLRRHRDQLAEEVEILQERSLAEVLVLQPRQMHVQDLPLHVLLRIFDMLDRTFLTDVVSAVCQRWLLAVCEPSLWARATLTYGNSKGSAMGATGFVRTLGSASMLYALECGLSPADPPAVHHMLTTCATAVEHLCFDLDTAAPEAVLRLMWNSRHCLKELSVREGPLGGSDFSYSQATRFWELIEGCRQLRSLVLFLSQKSGLSSCVYSFRPNPQPSLRTLYLDVGVLHEHAKLVQFGIVVKSLITAHRATLEKVGLPMLVSIPGSVAALSRCPSLRSVRMPVSQEVRHLSRCELLRELRLTTDNARRPFGLNPERVLQNICQLRQLHELNISHMGKCSDAHSAATAGSLGVLNELVELRRLRLTCLPTCDDLDRLASSPTAAPHLEVLYFGESCGDARDAGCRLPALRRLLQRRPQLHVSLTSIKVRDEEPLCCMDHRNLAHTNPVIPVTFVHHEYDQDCAQCASFNAVGGTTLSLLHDGQFLDGDVDMSWPESPTVSPARVFPSVVPDVKPLIAESQQDLPVPELDDSVTKEFLGPPHKYRKITSGSSSVAKTSKASQLKVKVTAKPRAPSERALAVAKRTQTKIKKSTIAAFRSGISSLSTEGPPGSAIFQSSGETLANSVKVSPRPSSEGKQLIISSPSEVSIPLSEVPNVIKPVVNDLTSPFNDCLLQVSLPSNPRVSLATAPSTTTSILRSIVTTLPSSTVTSTVSSTVSASQKPPLIIVQKPASKSPKRQVPKKAPVSRKGKATHGKDVAIPSVPSLLPPAADTSSESKTSSLTPSNIPLVSSTLPTGISRLTTGHAVVPPVEVQFGPGTDEQPPTPARTPPGALEDDAGALNASPRRHLNRACRPLSLADSDDSVDRIVSSTRKTTSRSTPRSRASKTYLGARPPVKNRKSAPATVSASTEDFSCDAAADDHSDGPFDAPADALTDAPADAHAQAPCDTPTHAPGDNLADAFSVVRTLESPMTPFSGFTPTCDTVYVEVSTDALKSDAAEDEVAAEYTLEGVVTAGSPVLQELQAAQPDGHCEDVKVEREEDALNNNSKTCNPQWCGDNVNTDPTWAIPVSVSNVEIYTDSNERGVV